ncbi:polysaccharide biosynthesis C-terminal domain-containing protein, partial [Staphylococcus haemolyticus]
SMLQGINKQKLTVFVILGSVFVKLILNIPLIMIFHTSGAVLSTAIALTVANVANLMILKVYAKFHFTDTLVQVAKIFIYSLIMMISVEVVYFLLSLFISVDRKSGAFIILIIGVIVGGLIYGTITIKNRLADEFLGDLPGKIRRKVGFLR